MHYLQGGSLARAHRLSEVVLHCCTPPCVQGFTERPTHMDRQSEGRQRRALVSSAAAAAAAVVNGEPERPDTAAPQSEPSPSQQQTQPAAAGRGHSLRQLHKFATRCAALFRENGLPAAVPAWGQASAEQLAAALTERLGAPLLGDLQARAAAGRCSGRV